MAIVGSTPRGQRRLSEIKRLLGLGKSYAEIGAVMEVSKQRIGQIVLASGARDKFPIFPYVPAKLKACREALGMSVRKYSLYLGVDFRTIERIENGECKRMTKAVADVVRGQIVEVVYEGQEENKP